MGLGFALVLTLIGVIREILGSGTLFANMQLLFGAGAASWEMDILGGSGLLMLVLPPGAFIVVGFLVALKNVIDKQIQRRAAAKKVPLAKGARRVRTTGTIA